MALGRGLSSTRIAIGPVAVAVAGLIASGLLAGCSSAAQQASDAVASPDVASGTSANQIQLAAVQRVAVAAKDRIALAPALAWARYQEQAPLDDPAGEASAAAAFVKEATAGGVPRDVANQTITTLLGESKAIEVRLNMEWATGVTQLPADPAQPLKSTLVPRSRAANAGLADAMAFLASVGLPPDWPAPLDAAGKQAAVDLPAGVTTNDLDTVLAAIRQWQPPAPPKAKTKAKAKAKEKRSSGE